MFKQRTRLRNSLAMVLVTALTLGLVTLPSNTPTSDALASKKPSYAKPASMLIDNFWVGYNDAAAAQAEENRKTNEANKAENARRTVRNNKAKAYNAYVEAHNESQASCMSAHLNWALKQGMSQPKGFATFKSKALTTFYNAGCGNLIEANSSFRENEAPRFGARQKTTGLYGSIKTEPLLGMLPTNLPTNLPVEERNTPAVLGAYDGDRFGTTKSTAVWCLDLGKTIGGAGQSGFRITTQVNPAFAYMLNKWGSNASTGTDYDARNGSSIISVAIRMGYVKTYNAATRSYTSTSLGVTNNTAAGTRYRNVMNTTTRVMNFNGGNESHSYRTLNTRAQDAWNEAVRNSAYNWSSSGNLEQMKVDPGYWADASSNNNGAVDYRARLTLPKVKSDSGVYQALPITLRVVSGPGRFNTSSGLTTTWSTTTREANTYVTLHNLYTEAKTKTIVSWEITGLSRNSFYYHTHSTGTYQRGASAIPGTLKLDNEVMLDPPGTLPPFTLDVSTTVQNKTPNGPEFAEVYTTAPENIRYRVDGTERYVRVLPDVDTDWVPLSSSNETGTVANVPVNETGETTTLGNVTKTQGQLEHRGYTLNIGDVEYTQIGTTDSYVPEGTTLTPGSDVELSGVVETFEGSGVWVYEDAVPSLVGTPENSLTLVEDETEVWEDEEGNRYVIFEGIYIPEGTVLTEVLDAEDAPLEPRQWLLDPSDEPETDSVVLIGGNLYPLGTEFAENATVGEDEVTSAHVLVTSTLEERLQTSNWLIQAGTTGLYVGTTVNVAELADLTRIGGTFHATIPVVTTGGTVNQEHTYVYSATLNRYILDYLVPHTVDASGSDYVRTHVDSAGYVVPLVNGSPAGPGAIIPNTGDFLTDRVTLTQSGSYPVTAPIRATYTVYGPLRTPPATRNEAPAGAPIFERGTVTLQQVTASGARYNNDVTTKRRVGESFVAYGNHGTFNGQPHYVFGSSTYADKVSGAATKTAYDQEWFGGAYYTWVWEIEKPTSAAWTRLEPNKAGLTNGLVVKSQYGIAAENHLRGDFPGIFSKAQTPVVALPATSQGQGTKSVVLNDNIVYTTLPGGDYQATHTLYGPFPAGYNFDANSGAVPTGAPVAQEITDSFSVPAQWTTENLSTLRDNGFRYNQANNEVLGARHLQKNYEFTVNTAGVYQVVSVLEPADGETQRTYFNDPDERFFVGDSYSLAGVQASNGQWSPNTPTEVRQIAVGTPVQDRVYLKDGVPERGTVEVTLFKQGTDGIDTDRQALTLGEGGLEPIQYSYNYIYSNLPEENGVKYIQTPAYTVFGAVGSESDASGRFYWNHVISTADGVYQTGLARDVAESYEFSKRGIQITSQVQKKTVSSGMVVLDAITVSGFVPNSGSTANAQRAEKIRQFGGATAVTAERNRILSEVGSGETHEGFQAWLDETGNTNNESARETYADVNVDLALEENFSAENAGSAWRDTNLITNTLYGPFESVPDESVTTGTPAGVSYTPAMNGTFTAKFPEAERLPGYYVVVSNYAGDRFINPITTRFDDEAETFAVVDVTTKAQPIARVGDLITDTAIVTGGLLGDGLWLQFDLYRVNDPNYCQPEDLDPSEDPAEDPTEDPTEEPTEDPAEEEEEVEEPCVEPSDTTPAHHYDVHVATVDYGRITEVGEYTSPGVEVLIPGTYYWRERLIERNPIFDPQPEGEDEEEIPLQPVDEEEETIVYGEPRLPNETTEVVEVTTTAVPSVDLGDTATDTALVVGNYPDNSFIVFEAYGRYEDEDGNSPEDTISEDTLAFTSEPIWLENTEPAVNGSLRETIVTSPEHIFEEPGEKYWVEKLYYLPEGVEPPAPEEPGTEEPGTEEPGTEEPGTEEPGTEEPGTEEPIDWEEVGILLHEGLPRLPNETTHVWRTGVSSTARHAVALGEPAHDVAHVEISPLTPEGTGFFLHFEAWKRGEGDLDTDVKVFTSEHQFITETGDYQSEDHIFEEVGEYYWTEVLSDFEFEERDRGLPRLPNETTFVFEATSTAVPVVKEGAEFYDVIHFNGSGDIPQGLFVSAELWEWGTGDETTDTLVLTTERQKIDGYHDYQTESVTVPNFGKYYWREIISNEEHEKLHYGEARLPNETTDVIKVSSTADPLVALGAEARDIAHIEGFGSFPEGLELTFEVWKQGAGDLSTDRLVQTTSSIDLVNWGDYKSEAVRLNEVGTYYWVEIVTDSEGEVVHRGEARLPNETTKVDPMPRTGTNTQIIWITGAVLLLGGTTLAAVREVKRRKSS